MATTYLSRTPSANNNSVGKWTYSAWIKRNSIHVETNLISFYTDTNNRSALRFDSDDKLRFYEVASGSTTVTKLTNRLFRDTGAWYHIMLAVDKTLGSPLTEIYINGVQETSFATDDGYTQNQTGVFNNAIPLTINTEAASVNNPRDISMAHIHFTDGNKYAPTVFGEFDSTSGIWVPKTAPSVTYGTNGFFLKFENSAAMGTDSSGNGNNFTVTGTLTQTIDTPSNNFATLSPAPSIEYNSSAFYEYGGTNCRSSTANFIAGVSQMYLDQGKWYFEMQTATADAHIGIAGEDKIMNGGTSGGVNNRLFYYEDTTGYAYSYNGANGQIYFSTPSDGTQTATYGNTFSSSDTIGCFADLDNNKLYFSKNGTLQNSGTGYDIQDGVYYAFGTSVYQSNTSLNFGNGTFKGVKLTGTTYTDANGEGIFKYSPNQGGAANFDSAAKNFYALCTKNIKEFG